jgi:nucleoside-diphosphate-sugar epimerase
MNEDTRLGKIEEKLKNAGDSRHILLIGSSHYTASHILAKFLDSVPSSHVTIADSKDPRIAFLNPKIRHYKGSSRVTVVQVSPFDWDWLESTLDTFDVIINHSCVHDATYCANNPLDSAYRNSMQATGLMNAIQSGKGWKSDGKLIICSTDKVYGNQEKLPTPETAPLNPVGVRATTRAAQEMIQRGMAESMGIPYVCLRYGTTYGEYTAPEKAIYAWCRALLMHQPILMNGEFAKDNSPARDWVHIDDVAAVTAFCSIAPWDTNIKNEVYNIGAGESQIHYIWNIAEAMKTILCRGTQTIMSPWRDAGERNLRIWLDTNKAKEKLFFLPGRELVYAATRELAPWIAYHDLMWSEEQIVALKKSLGVTRERSVATPGAAGVVGGGQSSGGSAGHLAVQSQ